MIRPIINFFNGNKEKSLDIKLVETNLILLQTQLKSFKIDDSNENKFILMEIGLYFIEFNENKGKLSNDDNYLDLMIIFNMVYLNIKSIYSLMLNNNCEYFKYRQKLVKLLRLINNKKVSSFFDKDMSDGISTLIIFKGTDKEYLEYLSLMIKNISYIIGNELLNKKN